MHQPQHSVHKIFAHRQAQLDKDIREWGEHQTLLEPIVLAIDEVAALAEQQIEMRWEGDDLNIIFCGTKEFFTEIFKIVRQAGFEPHDRPKDNEPSWNSFWTKEGSDASIWMSYVSTVCRRVQIGTKMEEVPVYEVRCE